MIWNLLARALAQPAVSSLIVRMAKSAGKPFHIERTDGSLYMGRWWLVKWGKLRSYLPALRLHHLADRDRDRHLHDHPWDYRTIVLTGGYTEELVTGEHVWWPPGSTVARRAEHFHRIVDVEPDTYTLFFTWRWRHVWGFLVDGWKLEHEVYEGYVKNFGVGGQ